MEVQDPGGGKCSMHVEHRLSLCCEDGISVVETGAGAGGLGMDCLGIEEDGNETDDTAHQFRREARFLATTTLHRVRHRWVLRQACEKLGYGADVLRHLASDGQGRRDRSRTPESRPDKLCEACWELDLLHQVAAGHCPNTGLYRNWHQVQSLKKRHSG